MICRAEIRDVATRQFSCTCPDFRINGLGTCKHVEGILLLLERRHRVEFKAAGRGSSGRADIVPAADGLRVERNADRLPDRLAACFDDDGFQFSEFDPEALVEEARASQSPAVRVSQDVRPWLEVRERERDRTLSRRDYEVGVANGTHPEHVTNSPFFTIANYEQIVADSLDINARLRPDVVILDVARARKPRRRRDDQHPRPREASAPPGRR